MLSGSQLSGILYEQLAAIELVLACNKMMAVRLPVCCKDAHAGNVEQRAAIHLAFACNQALSKHLLAASACQEKRQSLPTSFTDSEVVDGLSPCSAASFITSACIANTNRITERLLLEFASGDIRPAASDVVQSSNECVVDDERCLPPLAGVDCRAASDELQFDSLQALAATGASCYGDRLPLDFDVVEPHARAEPSKTKTLLESVSSEELTKEMFCQVKAPKKDRLSHFAADEHLCSMKPDTLEEPAYCQHGARLKPTACSNIDFQLSKPLETLSDLSPTRSLRSSSSGLSHCATPKDVNISLLVSWMWCDYSSSREVPVSPSRAPRRWSNPMSCVSAIQQLQCADQPRSVLLRVHRCNVFTGFQERHCETVEEAVSWLRTLNVESGFDASV